MEEIWKKVNGFDGLYEVSNTGKVKSFVKYHRGALLKLYANKKGYLLVYLNKIGSDYRLGTTVHKLVYNAFIGQVPDGLQINHIDGNKQNNCIENLEVCTPKENVNHATKLGLRTANINLQSGAMFTENQIEDIRALIANGVSNKKISEKYSCHFSTISKIRTGVNYNKKKELDHEVV